MLHCLPLLMMMLFSGHIEVRTHVGSNASVVYPYRLPLTFRRMDTAFAYCLYSMYVLSLVLGISCTSMHGCVHVPKSFRVYDKGRWLVPWICTKRSYAWVHSAWLKTTVCFSVRGHASFNDLCSHIGKLCFITSCPQEHGVGIKYTPTTF